MAMAVPLSEEDIGMCQQAFAKFDPDGSGAIRTHELKQTLSSMGQDLSVEEIFDIAALADPDSSGEIAFPEFMRIIERQRHKAAQREDRSDAIAAFVALGGQEDRSGRISIARLQSVASEFGLTLDFQKVSQDIDVDGSGTVEFHQLREMISDVIHEED